VTNRTWNAVQPDYVFAGVPVHTSSLIDDGVVIMAGGRALIGTRPLTWVESTKRAAFRDRLGHVYEWLGEPVPDPCPRVWERLVEAGHGRYGASAGVTSNPQL
jgi:hypothetical protein